MAYIIILPDPDWRHRCRHRGGDPDCSCFPECPECGTIYTPTDGHDCLDDVPADELLDAAKELRDSLDACETERDRLRAELERTKGELERVRGLLMVALPHVEASAGAQHLMDGFRPRKRPLDDAVEEIRAALERKDGA